MPLHRNPFTVTKTFKSKALERLRNSRQKRFLVFYRVVEEGLERLSRVGWSLMSHRDAIIRDFYSRRCVELGVFLENQHVLSFFIESTWIDHEGREYVENSWYV